MTVISKNNISHTQSRKVLIEKYREVKTVSAIIKERLDTFFNDCTIEYHYSDDFAIVLRRNSDNIAFFEWTLITKQGYIDVEYVLDAFISNRRYQVFQVFQIFKIHFNNFLGQHIKEIYSLRLAFAVFHDINEDEERLLSSVQGYQSPKDVHLKYPFDPDFRK